MFGIDFEALLLLAVLAFILFGPQKLPEYAAKLGCLIAKLREATTDLSQQCQTSFPNVLQPPPPKPAVNDPAYSQPAGQPAAGEPVQIAADEPTVTGIVCHMCCQPVTKDFIFCPKCGHKIDDLSEPPQPLPDEKPASSKLAS